MQELIEKVADKLVKKEQELDIREQALNSLLPLKEQLLDKVRSATVSNNVAVLQEACKEISQAVSNQSFDSVVQAIEKQTEALEDESGKQILSELKAMIQSLKVLEKKNYFDEKAFSNVFDTSLAKIVEILQRQEEIPKETKYARNDKGLITMVTEVYNDYTLKHSWQYNTQDKLVKVKTTRYANT